MNPVTGTAATLAAAVGAANTAANAAWGTGLNHAGWFILVATASIVVGLLFYLIHRLRRLGRG